MIALVLVALIGMGVWIVFPWKHIGGVRVDDARVVNVDPARMRPGDSARQVAVTFSSPSDLATLRADAGAGFLNAVLAACDDGDARTSQVVSQRDGYFVDTGRVVRLPATPGTSRARYRALFDDRLARTDGGEITLAPAIGTAGGLCFSLEGGSMWLGRIWSDDIALRIAEGGAAR